MSTFIICKLLTSARRHNCIAFCEARADLTAAEWDTIRKLSEEHGLQATRVSKSSSRFLLVRYFEDALSKGTKQFKDSVIATLMNHRFFCSSVNASELTSWQRDLIA